MNKKDMNFLQALNKHNISLFGDVDKDKVPNVFDCKPFDDEQDGVFGRALNILSKGRYGQSKEEYDAEKITRTSFERDDSGKVIRTTRDGREVSPWKSSRQLEQEYAAKLLKDRIEQKKAINALIKEKIELQQKKQKLLQEQRRLAQLYPQSSSIQQALATMLGVAPDGRSSAIRPGYYIEQVPELPKGYKWKKIPKAKKGQSKVKPLVCDQCKIPLILVPDVYGILRPYCPRCKKYVLM